MGKLGQREKLMLIILLVVAGAAGFYYFLLSPQLKAYAQLKAELTGEQGKLAQAQAAAASLKDENERLARVKEEFAETGKLFATEMRGGADVILLGLKSAAGNILITGLEPGNIQENPYTLAMPLKMTVQGDYQNLLSFINRYLENFTNYTEIRSLKIEASSPATPGTGKISSGTVKATLGMIIYSANNPGERIHLEELARWLQGRENIFRPAAAIAPIPELAGQPTAPAELSGPSAAGIAGKSGRESGGVSSGAESREQPSTVGEAVYHKPALQSASEYPWRK